MGARFPDAVERLLREAGWGSPRGHVHLDMPRGYDLFPAAERVLLEFGGIKVGTYGKGLECCTNDVEISPIVGERVPVSNVYNRLKLFPLGWYDHCNVYIFIDEKGQIHTYFDGLFEYFAPDFDKAITKLLLGLLPDPDPDTSRQV
jgi:hypothetical protein